VIRFSATLFVVLRNAAGPNAAAQNVAGPNVALPNVVRVVTREVPNEVRVVTHVAPNVAVPLVASPFHDDQLWELLAGEPHEVETQVPKLAPVVRCVARV